MLTIVKMMGLQTNLFLAAGLALVPIAHQAGDAQILIEPRWILILTPLQLRVVEPSNIHLHILDDESADGERKLSHYANHFLHVGFDRRRKASAPFA
jgi:hypothetical protein